MATMEHALLGNVERNAQNAFYLTSKSIQHVIVYPTRNVEKMLILCKTCTYDIYLVLLL